MNPSPIHFRVKMSCKLIMLIKSITLTLLPWYKKIYILVSVPSACTNLQKPLEFPDKSGFCYANEVTILFNPFNKMVIESPVLLLSSVSHSSKWPNLKRGQENSPIHSQTSPSEVWIVLGAIWGRRNPVKLGPYNLQSCIYSH